jgi:hypothetical protein
MSILRCDNCTRLIDSDQDVDCFVDDPRHSIPPHPDLILCAVCRETDDWLPTDAVYLPRHHVDTGGPAIAGCAVGLLVFWAGVVWLAVRFSK